MGRFAPFFLLIAVAGCTDPPKQNRAALYYQGLDDLWRWHPSRGGAGDPAYDGLLALDPPESVPILIQGLTETAATKIDDGRHPPPTVGHVCFLMLLKLFALTPKDFDREGVWLYPHEDNPIYALNLDGAGVRQRAGAKFTRLALERKWLGEQKP